MNKFAFLTAAAVVTTLAAGPALARDTTDQNTKPTVKTQHIKKKQRADARRDNRRVARGYDRGYNRGYDQGLEQGAQFDRNLNRSSSTTYYYGNNNQSGFWPAEAAAGIVDGAVTAADDAVIAAGDIATAPFRDTYAYDNSYTAPVYRTNDWNNGWNNGWDNNWARRQSVQEGGFACTPGSWYTNSYGNTQLCQ